MKNYSYIHHKVLSLAMQRDYHRAQSDTLSKHNAELRVSTKVWVNRHSTLDATCTNLNSRVDALQSQVSDYKAYCTDANKTIDNLHATIASLRAENQAQANKIEEKNSALTKLRSNIGYLEADKRVLHSTIHDLRKHSDRPNKSKLVRLTDRVSKVYGLEPGRVVVVDDCNRVQVSEQTRYWLSHEEFEPVAEHGHGGYSRADIVMMIE